VTRRDSLTHIRMPAGYGRQTSMFLNISLHYLLKHLKLTLAGTHPSWARTFVSTSHHRSRLPTYTSPPVPSLRQVEHDGAHEIRRHHVEIYRINRALRPLSRRLVAGEALEAMSAFERALSSDKRGIYTNDIYIAAIIQFLRFDHIAEARRLYDSMRRLCSRVPAHLALRMDSLAIAYNDELDRSRATKEMVDVVQKPQFSVSGLIQLVRQLILVHGWDSTSTDPIIEAYIGNGPKKRFLSENALANLFASRTTAQPSWAANARAVLSWNRAEDQQLPAMAAPYNILLKELPLNKEDGADILMQTMKHAGVKPNSQTFDALITQEEKRGRYDKIFHLYATMKKLDVSPTESTVCILFRALERSRLSRIRGSRTRKEKTLPKAQLPPTRGLYRDVMMYHHRHTRYRPGNPSPILTTAVVNVALRLFMAEGDYAGAFVAARTFQAAGLQPTLRTYKLVVTTLAHRMQDVASDDKGDKFGEAADVRRAWLNTLLRPVSKDMERHAELRKHLLYMQELLALGAEASLNKEDITFPVPAHGQDWLPETVFQQTNRGIVPSVAMLLDLQDVPPTAILDPRPLQRILRRVLVAGVRPQTDVPLSRVSSKLIKEARAEMLPDEVKNLDLSRRSQEGRTPKPDQRKLRSKRFARVHI
jgi:hypothetical protein